MLIKLNKKSFEISNNLAKLSPYISNLHKLGRAIPFLNSTPEIFEIFKEWFEILDKIGIGENLYDSNKLPDNCVLVFFPKFFTDEKKLDIETLLKLYELSIFNQINLLTNTMIYILLNFDKHVLMQLLEDKVYFIYLHNKRISNGEISFKFDETEMSNIEFNIFEQFKNKTILNYHPSIFSKYKYICDFSKNINEDCLKTLCLNENIYSEIAEKIKNAKDIMLNNIYNNDSIIIFNATSINFDITGCKIVSVSNKINTSSLINYPDITMDEIEKFISIKQNTQPKTQIKSTTFIVEDGKKYIEEHAFENCKFEKIILPNSLCYIGNSAFKNCKKFTLCYKDKQGTIHENEISPDVIIKNEAFYNCDLPENLHQQILKINSKAFDSNDEFYW